MANRDAREGREELRGEEEHLFDLFAQVLTSEQWAGLLKAPLERAAAKGNRGLAQKLLRAGANIGHALHEAAEGGHGEVVTDLLENGASVAAKKTSHLGYTPLHVAAQEGKTEIVQLLLVKGADKDALDNIKRTPLHVATSYGRVAAALALLAAGADVSLRCGRGKETVVHVAAQRGDVGIMRVAIEHGADVDSVDADQDTPLHGAVLFNRGEAINALLEAGANIEARNCFGYTPLHCAAEDTNLEAVLFLLKHSSDVNAQDSNQRTPLHFAAATAGGQGVVEVVDSLLRSGADETILDHLGKTAADVVKEEFEEEYQLAEGVDRVRELLANAPADRAWRRRGYLVLCRAHPDRMQQIQDISSAQPGMARRTRTGAKMGKTEAGGCSGAVEASPVGGQTDGDWAIVVASVLVLREEGIFRAIVGYL